MIKKLIKFVKRIPYKPILLLIRVLAIIALLSSLISIGFIIGLPKDSPYISNALTVLITSVAIFFISNFKCEWDKEEKKLFRMKEELDMLIKANSLSFFERQVIVAVVNHKALMVNGCIIYDGNDSFEAYKRGEIKHFIMNFNGWGRKAKND